MFSESGTYDEYPAFSVYGTGQHHYFQWSHYIHTTLFFPDHDGEQTMRVYMSNCQIEIYGKRFGKNDKKDEHGGLLTPPERMFSDHILVSVSIDRPEDEDPNDAFVSDIRVIFP